MNKTKRINIRLTPDDLSDLKARALESGMTLSNYLVYKGLDKKMMDSQDRELYMQLLEQAVNLNRIGNLFKFAISKDCYDKAQLNDLIKDFKLLRHKILQIMSDIENGK